MKRLVLSLVSGPILAAAAGGTLGGRVLDEAGRPVSGAVIRLVNPVSGFRQVVRSGPDGGYTLRNLPLSAYHLEVVAPGFREEHREIEIRSSLPLALDLVLPQAGAEVAVAENLSLLDDHAVSALEIDETTIRRSPAVVQSRALESILLSTPGVVADENGRFHFRGSHGQVMYVVDGVPMTDQMHLAFSNSLDPAQARNLEIVTGGIPAEHGGKPVAVVAMTTKSGLGTPEGFEGEASLGAARYGTGEAGFSLRGGTASRGWFATGGLSRSDRFADPVDFKNHHNSGETARLFTRFDWILGGQDTLRLSVSGGRTRRDVVNLASQQARGQDQQVRTGDANLSLGWSRMLSPEASLDLVAYVRTATFRLDPTEELGEGFDGSGRDFPYWARSDRRLENLGLGLAFTRRWGTDNTFKAGLQWVRFPLRERFDFAIPDQSRVEDEDSPLYAFTPAGGGAIFRFADRLAPELRSAFAQSDAHLGPLTFQAGLRFDQYVRRGVRESLVQPRLGAAWTLEATRTLLRANYDRLLVTPENENLAFVSSQQAWDLNEDLAGTPVRQVRSERQHSTVLGVDQQFGRRMKVSFEVWERRSENAADSAQFLNTGILFPIAAKRGDFQGWNLRADLTPWQGFSAYLSLGRTRAIFEEPLTGGFEAGGHAHGDGDEEAPARFLIDHDQKLAAQLGLRYEGRGLFAQVQVRHDSGLVAGDPAEAAGDPDLDFGRAYVRFDASDGVWRVKPRTLVDLGLGWELKLGPRRALSLSADLLNATDRKGLYNFLSTFGGTHVLPPRTLALRARLTF
jgi:hypothetical protein